MNNVLKASLFEGRRTVRHRMMGVVLPVVLVVLTVLTGIVVTQVRRSTIDERLAANTRETVQLDSAVQAVLRWCEAQTVLEPFKTRKVIAGTTIPAWRVAANWTSGASLNFTGTDFPNIINAGAFEPACVIEEATCELSPPISPTGQVSNGCNGIDERWMKVRITARVATDAPDFISGRRFMRTQSELRIFTD